MPAEGEEERTSAAANIYNCQKNRNSTRIERIVDKVFGNASKHI